MSQLVFAAPPVVTAPLLGRSDRVPIRRIFCVGRNYEAHAREMGVAVDREAPFYFTKAAEHYVPSGSTVPYPPGTSNYHYELELVVVIGAPAFRVPAQGALDCVFGYACGLDMTRRDLQLAAKSSGGRGIWAKTSSSRPCCPRSFRRPRSVIPPPVRLSCASTARSSSVPTSRS
jgi:fumarylpyruvate hydrolase